MSKIIFNTIPSSFQATSYLNSNFDTVEQAFQQDVLYRNNPTGEPNEMNNDLDMNGYNILNLGNATVLASASVVIAVSWGTQIDGTTTYTATTANSYKNTEVSASSSLTATVQLNAESSMGWASGEWLGFIQKGLGPVRFVGGAGVTVHVALPTLSIQYGRWTAWYRGSDTWYVNGGS